MHACGEKIRATNAPWHVGPADNKWFTQLAVRSWKRSIKLDLTYPTVSSEQRGAAVARAELAGEKWADLRQQRCLTLMSTAIPVLGGVGLCLLGMTVMTDGLKAMAGSALRTVPSKAAATPISGSFWGAVVRGRSPRPPRSLSPLNSSHRSRSLRSAREFCLLFFREQARCSSVFWVQGWHPTIGTLGPTAGFVADVSASTACRMAGQSSDF
jgi:hypothetical protein